MSNKARKGQVSSIDALVATVVFALLLTFLMVFWFMSMDNIANLTTKNRMETAAVGITDVLLKSSGNPYNWEDDPSSVKIIGLAVSEDDDNVISRIKVENFTAMDYNRTKTIFGLDNATEFYFILEDLGGNSLYETGNPDIKEENTVVSLVRFGVLGEGGRLTETVRMRLMVYES